MSTTPVSTPQPRLTDLSTAKRVVEDFESFEQHEMPLWNQQREVELVRHALRCLAYPGNGWSRQVLEHLLASHGLTVTEVGS